MKRCFVCLLLLLSGVGCDDSPATDAGALPADAGPGADEEVTDGGSNVTCSFPAAMVAGTTETDALADAPARCGMDAHTWLRSDELGAVVSVGEADRYPTTLLAALAVAAEVTLPRPPELTANVRVVRYQTQDRGALTEATMLVATPELPATGQPLDVLLFLHGTSGFSAGCGPTEDMASIVLTALLASYGYMVVVPDFLGLETGEATYGQLHPYLVGQPTAIASIDAVRAAAALDPADRDGSCVSTRVVTFGGSQGGHAALWVDRLMPYYARELEHLGVVATVPPADILGEITRALQMRVNATANSAAFYLTAPFWYGYGDRLDEVFVSPHDTALPAALAADCSPDGLLPNTLEELFTTGALTAATDGTFADLDPWGCISSENGLVTTSIARLGGDSDSFGVLFITGQADPLVNTPIERGSFQALCEAGMPMTYLECEGANHGQGTSWALPEILRFIDARFGEEVFQRPASCVPPAATRCEGTPP